VLKLFGCSPNIRNANYLCKVVSGAFVDDE
jgi:hypothetical protein